jgi:hypothetical protein
MIDPAHGQAGINNGSRAPKDRPDRVPLETVAWGCATHAKVYRRLNAFLLPLLMFCLL